MDRAPTIERSISTTITPHGSMLLTTRKQEAPDGFFSPTGAQQAATRKIPTQVAARQEPITHSWNPISSPLCLPPPPPLRDSASARPRPRPSPHGCARAAIPLRPPFFPPSPAYSLDSISTGSLIASPAPILPTRFSPPPRPRGRRSGSGRP